MIKNSNTFMRTNWNFNKCLYNYLCNLLGGTGYRSVLRKDPNQRAWLSQIYWRSPLKNILCLRQGLFLVWETIWNCFLNITHSQSRQWPRGVCADPSVEDPPTEKWRLQTSLEAAAAVCGGSHRTFHQRHGCRKEAEAEGSALTRV